MACYKSGMTGGFV